MNKKLIKSLFIFLINCIAIQFILIWTIAGVMLFPVGFLFMKTIQGYLTCFITRKCIWIYGRVWQFLFSFFVVFIPPKIHGDPFKDPGIIVVNHRSFFDTYCMNMMPVCDVCFAARAWPFKIPLYNIFMKLAGYINIENFAWNETVAVSKKNIKKNSYILFFPEGHRSKDKTMSRFYSGAFKLAIENNVPVIPICLTGTQDLLPPHRYYLKPAKIKMEIMEPVYPEQFDGDRKHIAFKKYVKAKMAERIKHMDENSI